LIEQDGQQQLRFDCAAIIPAFDEAPRITGIAQAAVDSKLFSEVIVVDDGSRDGTATAAESIGGIRVMRHECNLGKSQAMRTGLDSSSSQYICFLDADLLNVSSAHLQLLTEPVCTGECRASLAVFRGGRRLTSLAQKISPLISGQRCLERRLLDDFTDWDSRYGIETAINEHLSSIGVQQRIVTWHGAAQVMKEEKRGCLAGFVARLGMYSDIARAKKRSRRR
jgi:glycosyltransferase involved in cell wall biosynthesis